MRKFVAALVLSGALAGCGEPGRLEPSLTASPTPSAAPAPEGMVWVPGGEFVMGTTDPMMSDARPLVRVAVDGFWMDRTEVTNEQFARFVKETGYVTIAERAPDPRDYPGVPPEQIVAGSVVFSPPSGEVPLDDHYAWWRYVKGASWRHPEGPASDLAGRERHPAVHIAWEDAAAYARWAGKRLPTEAEWERAARGGLEGRRYVWGDEFKPGDRFQANTFQGRFPSRNTSADGFAATSPVASFPANGYGLYDMAGNVWEWCADWYRPDYFATLDSAGRIVRNPPGPESSWDPQEPAIPKRVQKGGSFLCTDQYCERYIPGGRGKGASDTGASHVGFRCVLTPR
jgi:formylglycine-generating enzyme required for sulfatase activity